MKRVNKFRVPILVGVFLLVLAVLLFAFKARQTAATGNEETEISTTVSDTVEVTETETETTTSVSETEAETVTEAAAETQTETDRDTYYKEHSEVIETIPVDDSEDAPSEGEAIDILKERGFDQYSVEYEYDMEGDYVNEQTAEEGSEEKKPMYFTYYMTEQGDFWTIFVINGSIYANPVSYNMDSELSAQLLISENETLTSYNSENGKYYVNIPDESEVILKVIDRIDAETLEKLTTEEINKL